MNDRIADAKNSPKTIDSFIFYCIKNFSNTWFHKDGERTLHHPEELAVSKGAQDWSSVYFPPIMFMLSRVYPNAVQNTYTSF